MVVNRAATSDRDQAPPADATQRRRILASGAIGTTIEYFDFLLYGLVAPSVFEVLFFPHASAVVGTIAVLGTFAIGYLARPLGGIVFGHLGDRVGRKPIMFTTLVMMGASTTLIGLLPSYAAVGVAAPVLLVLLRFAQGFALGGETVGSVILAIESAPSGKRGGYAGVIQVGAAIGSVLASFAAGLVAHLPRADMLSWGWRLPFLASALLVLVGVYVRVKIEESPLFRRALSAAQQQERLPLVTALRREPKACLTTFLCTITETSMLQMFTVYALVYGVQTLGIDRATLLNGVLIGNIVGIVANPLFGRVSDYVGRRPMIAASLLIGAGYVAFAYFPMLRTHNTTVITLAIAIPPAVIQTLIFAVEGSYYGELFRSARQRFSGLGFSRQLGGVIGGVFPIIATSLFVGTGTIWSVIGYYVGISAISLSAVALARETRLETLR
jgi:MFS transporter, MHS family, shikimate and dehydroshikimate transport protein